MAEHGLTTADIDAHAGGKKRGPKPGAKAAAKSSASVAKYRDPKTGATWSGHGRAPAWIANANDPSRFLIDGANAVDKRPVVKKAAAKKTPAAKKASGTTALSKKMTAPAPGAKAGSEAAVTV